MTIAQMKQILTDKLKAENCYFTEKDITIEKSGNRYKVIIADYEHIPFEITTEAPDDFFGYMVYVWQGKKIIADIESKKDYDLKTALIELGYYIGTRF